MHLRRLTFTTLALPFVFAACSGESTEGVDVPVYTETVSNEATDDQQPAGNNGAEDDLNETPNPAPQSDGTVGDGNTETNQATDLQQPDGTDMSSGANDDGTEGETTEGETTEGETTEPVPFDCVLPELPDPQNLTYVNERLPDPFTFLDGTPVTTKAQWECRRKEILAIAERYLYAPVPPPPDAVSGSVNGGTINIQATVGGNTANFTANITGNGEAIVVGGNIPGGGKTLNFGNGFEGQVQNLYGFSEINPNIARGWMIDRVMDVLEQNPDSEHDPQKIVVTGCSGCGKGALLTGVFSRAPVTVVVESGGGGAASFRQGEWFRNGEGNSTWQCADALPQNIDNLENNGICGPWVTSAATFFRNNPERVVNLPMDQHLLMATIAPRYLVHYTNYNGVNAWCHLAGTGEALSAYAAKPVWNALGVPERMGFSMYNANHCQASNAQMSLTGEMLNLAFNGDTSANTDVLNIIPDGVQQPVSEWDDMWIDWNMETVLE